MKRSHRNGIRIPTREPVPYISPGVPEHLDDLVLSSAQVQRRGPLNVPPRNCAVCGKSFAPTNNRQRYCSPPCAADADSETVVCERCGKSIRKRKQGVPGRFCSVDCSARATAPARAEKLRRPTTHRRRAVGWGLKAKGEESCRRCGGQANHLHHIVPRSRSHEGYEDVAGNGLPLCWECHMGWHDRRVTINHAVLTDVEFLRAVEIAGGAWVERNYPDEHTVALLRLDELMNRRRLNPERGEAFDERFARLTNSAEEMY